MRLAVLTMQRTALIVSCLLCMGARPGSAATYGGLSSTMWERVRKAEATVGNLAPTKAPQAPPSLSLPEALAAAFAHNADFRGNQANLLNAQAALWVAEQRLFNTLTAHARRGPDPGEPIGTSAQATFISRWQGLGGGDVVATVGTGDQDQLGLIFSQRPSIDLLYDQPLIRGAGLASSTYERIRGARSALCAQELSYYDAYQSLAQTIIENYQAVVLAQGEVEIAQQAVDRAQQFYDRSYVMFYGKTPSGDVVELPPGVEWKSRVTVMDLGQARLDWERAKQELISAQESFQDTMDQLLLAMGFVAGSTPKLTTTFTYTPQQYNEPELVQTAMANSTGLGRLALSHDDAEADLRIARSGARPDLIASAGLTDVGQTVGGETLSEGWFAGMRVEMPFVDRSLEAAVGTAQRSLLVLDQNMIATRDQVAQNMQGLIRTAASARARIDIGVQSADLAKQNRVAAQAMFDEGLTDSLQVVDAEQRLVQAQRSLLQEQGNYLLTTVRVRRAMGEDIAQGWDAAGTPAADGQGPGSGAQGPANAPSSTGPVSATPPAGKSQGEKGAQEGGQSGDVTGNGQAK